AAPPCAVDENGHRPVLRHGEGRLREARAVGEDFHAATAGRRPSAGGAAGAGGAGGRGGSTSATATATASATWYGNGHGRFRDADQAFGVGDRELDVVGADGAVGVFGRRSRLGFGRPVPEFPRVFDDRRSRRRFRVFGVEQHSLAGSRGTGELAEFGHRVRRFNDDFHARFDRRRR